MSNGKVAVSATHAADADMQYEVIGFSPCLLGPPIACTAWAGCVAEVPFSRVSRGAGVQPIRAPGCETRRCFGHLASG